MSDRIPSRGDFSIDSSLLTEHEWVSDWLIDGELGTACTLVYPPTDSECINCLSDPTTGRSANIYRTGGPIPFTDHTLCPWCGGAGRRYENTTGSIRMRVYWGGMEVNAAVRQFHNIPEHIQNPAGLVFVIGYMVNLPSFERSESILINSNIERKEWRFIRASEAIPWGFNKNRYFAAMLTRQ